MDNTGTSPGRRPGVPRTGLQTTPKKLLQQHYKRLQLKIKDILLGIMQAAVISCLRNLYNKLVQLERSRLSSCWRDCMNQFDNSVRCAVLGTAPQEYHGLRRLRDLVQSDDDVYYGLIPALQDYLERCCKISGLCVSTSPREQELIDEYHRYAVAGGDSQRKPTAQRRGEAVGGAGRQRCGLSPESVRPGTEGAPQRSHQAGGAGSAPSRGGTPSTGPSSASVSISIEEESDVPPETHWSAEFPASSAVDHLPDMVRYPEEQVNAVLGGAEQMEQRALLSGYSDYADCRDCFNSLAHSTYQRQQELLRWMPQVYTDMVLNKRLAMCKQQYNFSVQRRQFCLDQLLHGGVFGQISSFQQKQSYYLYYINLLRQKKFQVYRFDSIQRRRQLLQNKVEQLRILKETTLQENKYKILDLHKYLIRCKKVLYGTLYVAKCEIAKNIHNISV